MTVGKVVEGKWRHKKRGSTYIVIENALLQTDKPITDMTPLVIYIAADGTVWVRPRDEFLDGRFEEITA